MLIILFNRNAALISSWGRLLFSGTKKCCFKILPHMRHGKIPSWNSPSLDCSKRWDWKEYSWSSCGKQFVSIKTNQRSWLMWKLYTCLTCFRHFWKNKQLHICNYKVKKSLVGPRANLANWVLKQSALMLLSKSMLWLFNQSLHLEKIKKKIQQERKHSEFETRVGYSDSLQIPSSWSVSTFQSQRDVWKACIFMGRISSIHIFGARLTLCNTSYGPEFLEL